MISSQIHPTAIIGENVILGNNVTIGPYTIIDDEVKIGNGSNIGNFNTIKKYTEIGENCQIYHNCVIGELPQDLKFGGEKTFTKIGNNVTIREFVTIHRGTTDRRETLIGSNTFLMAYAHVAHDCIVGNNVTFINQATLGGHVVVEDWATLSGGVMVHQFVRIGEHSFIGGLYRVTQDVPPFMMAVGEPLRYGGINSVGLRRRGFSSKDRINIKHAYRIYYNSRESKSDSLKKIKSDYVDDKNVLQIIDFIDNSKRGTI